MSSILLSSCIAKRKDREKESKLIITESQWEYRSICGVSPSVDLMIFKVKIRGNCVCIHTNSDLLHCRQILYCLSHQGSPTYMLFGH